MSSFNVRQAFQEFSFIRSLLFEILVLDLPIFFNNFASGTFSFLYLVSAFFSKTTHHC